MFQYYAEWSSTVPNGGSGGYGGKGDGVELTEVKVLDAELKRSADAKNAPSFVNEAEVDRTRSKIGQNGDLSDHLKRINMQTNGDISIKVCKLYMYS